MQLCCGDEFLMDARGVVTLESFLLPFSEKLDYLLMSIEWDELVQFIKHLKFQFHRTMVKFDDKINCVNLNNRVIYSHVQLFLEFCIQLLFSPFPVQNVPKH